MEFLHEYYPSLYRIMLIRLNMLDKLQDYNKHCQGCEDDPLTYSKFVHGYLIPMFDQKYPDGLLKQSKFYAHVS